MPPTARIATVSETHWGEVIVDPYRWMENFEDRDWLPFMRGQAAYARSVLDAELRQAQLTIPEITTWIMHAGGRDVLQALRERIGLSVDDLRYSAAILDEYGNMSSAFVYFVLKHALEDNAPPGWWWMSAFGAGFSCHGALLAVGARA